MMFPREIWAKRISLRLSGACGRNNGFSGEWIYEGHMDVSVQFLLLAMDHCTCPGRFAAGLLNLKQKGVNMP
jgi:hypothetical protein